MKEEKTFENKVKKWLSEEGFYFVKFFANSRTKKGVPDILACCYGRFVGLEVKSEDGSPSPLQLIRLNQIAKAGGIAILLYPDTFEQFKMLIKGELDYEDAVILRYGQIKTLKEIYF